MIAPDSKGGTQNVWEDWRGNLYTVGSLVLYARMSGRSCELAEGRVVDLYEVYNHPDTYRWTRLEPGEDAPLHDTWGWYNPETKEASATYRGEGWERQRVTVPCKVERHAKILPTNRTSRGWGYWNKKWVYDEAAQKGEFVETEQKPVILKITESVTAVTPYDIKDGM